MDNKFINATDQRPNAHHIIDAGHVKIDIEAIVEQIKNEKAWNYSDRNAMTVFKTNGLSIVIIALHKDAAMAKHKVDGLLSIQVIEGQIEISADSESINLKSGQMIVLHSYIEHSISAVEETVFLFTVTTSVKHFTD